MERQRQTDGKIETDRGERQTETDRWKDRDRYMERQRQTDGKIETDRVQGF